MIKLLLKLNHETPPPYFAYFANTYGIIQKLNHKASARPLSLSYHAYFAHSTYDWIQKLNHKAGAPAPQILYILQILHKTNIRQNTVMRQYLPGVFPTMTPQKNSDRNWQLTKEQSSKTKSEIAAQNLKKVI